MATHLTKRPHKKRGKKGTRYLADTTTKEVHDLLNEVGACQLDQVFLRRCAVSFDPDTPRQAQSEGYDKWHDCMGDLSARADRHIRAIRDWTRIVDVVGHRTFQSGGEMLEALGGTQGRTLFERLMALGSALSEGDGTIEVSDESRRRFVDAMYGGYLANTHMLCIGMRHLALDQA